MSCNFFIERYHITFVLAFNISQNAYLSRKARTDARTHARTHVHSVYPLLLQTAVRQLLTILATVATIETAIVDACDSVSTCSVPETTLIGCRLLATFLQLFFAQHILTVQARILNSCNLVTKKVYHMLVIISIFRIMLVLAIW